MQIFQRLLVGLFLMLGLFGIAQAQRSGESVIVREAVNDDFYGAGRIVQLLAAISGDAIIAGETLSITGPVSGDVIAAGRDVTIAAEVMDDIRAAGATVTIQDRVGGHVALAGRLVTIEAQGRVMDKAWLAGDTIRILGEVDGPVRAAGRRLEILGTVNQDLTFYGSELIVGDGARIGGNLNVHSEVEPVISANAEIGGQVVYLPLERQDEGFDASGLVAVVGIAIAALAVFIVWPPLLDRVAATARSAPAMHLVAGVGALILIPVLAVFLFITAVGGFLAIILLMSYLVLILAGFVAGIFILGTWIQRLFKGSVQRKVWARVLFIVAAAVALWLLSFVPVLGGLAFLALLVSGMGALCLSVARSWRSDLKNF